MATENIKNRKIYRICTDATNKVWDRINFLTNATSVDAADGDNMETKVGAIKGITTSTDVTEEGYAADATTVAALNESLGNLRFGYDETEQKYGYYVTDSEGADAFCPFSSGDWKMTFKVSSSATTNVNGTVLSPSCSGTCTVTCTNGELSISGTSFSGKQNSSHSNNIKVTLSNFNIIQ